MKRVKRKVNVRKHKRRLKSGNATIVRRHKRQLKTATKIRKHDDPDKMLLPDAEWYRQNTGEDFYNYLFDDKDNQKLFLEQCFPLKNDPHLPNGVLCSIVAWDKSGVDGHPRNRLILKRCGTDKEGYISCVHTMVTDISIEDLPKDLTELYGLSQGELIKMSPIEHFRALRSWAEGITEYGIENAILDSLADLDMPFGFNWELQRQFLEAIHETYGDVGVLLAVDVLNNIYNNLDGNYDWSNKRFELLSHYVIGCGADIEMLEKCYQLFPDHIESIRDNIAEIAINPNTPSHILENLYRIDSSDILNNNLASNPNTPIYILEKLHQHGILNTDYWLAKNPSTPIYILEGFSHDDDPDVRWLVANNPSTPIHILEKLSNDADGEVKYAVVENPSTPLHILESLFNDANLDVRCLVAENPRTPIHILEKFSNDEDSYIREAARENLKKKEVP